MYNRCVLNDETKQRCEFILNALIFFECSTKVRNKNGILWPCDDDNEYSVYCTFVTQLREQPTEIKMSQKK